MRVVTGIAHKPSDPYVAGLLAFLGANPALLDDRWSYRLLGEAFGIGPASSLFQKMPTIEARMARGAAAAGQDGGPGASAFSAAYDFTAVPEPYKTELKAYFWWMLQYPENHNHRWKQRAARLIPFCTDLAATAAALPYLIDYGSTIEGSGGRKGETRLRRMFEDWLTGKGYAMSRPTKSWVVRTEAGLEARHYSAVPFQTAPASALGRALVILRERMKPLDQRDVVLLDDVFDREDIPGCARSDPYIAFYNFRLPWLRDIARRHMIYRFQHRELAVGTLRSYSSNLRRVEECLLDLHADPRIEHIDQSFLDEDFLRWGNATRKLAGRNWYMWPFNMLDWAYSHLERDWQPLKFNRRNFRRLANPTPNGANYDNNMSGKMVPEVVMEQILSKRDLLPPQYKRMLIIERYTGMRGSDLHSLAFDCLRSDPTDKEFMIITFWQSKTKTENSKPLHKEDAAHALVIEVIRQQQNEVRQRFGRDLPYLFPTKQGDKISHLHLNVSRMFLANWCVEHDIRDEQGKLYKFKWHAFRHYYATEMALGGADVHLIQMELGHTSPRMAVYYVNERLKLRKKALIEKGGGRFIDIEGAVDERAAEIALRKESLSVDVPGGLCGMAGQLGEWCENNRACFTCQHFRADVEQIAFFEKEKATLGRTISRLQAEVEGYERGGKTRMAEIGRKRLDRSRKALEHVGTIVAAIKDKGAFHGSEPKQRRSGGSGGGAECARPASDRNCHSRNGQHR